MRRSFNKALIERIYAELDEEKSFLELLAKLRRENVINSHRTLRKYLELLVASGLVEEKIIPQRNINPKKLYRVTGRKPKIQVGLSLFSVYGLNREVPPETREVETDLLGLSKAKLLNGAAVASIEDFLVDVFNRYLKGEKHLIDLFLVVYLKNKVDLEYMVKRAGEAGIKTEILNFLETIDYCLREGWREEISPLNMALYLKIRDQYLKRRYNLKPRKHLEEDINSIVERLRKDGAPF